MFSGYLQAALYKGLNNAGGLAGWRWLFIFDAIISIPIALWGFYAIPDLPSNTRARWLTKEVRVLCRACGVRWWRQDREYGLERMESFGRAAPTGLTLKAIRRVYFDWHIWAFIFPYLYVFHPGQGFSWWDKELLQWWTTETRISISGWKLKATAWSTSIQFQLLAQLSVLSLLWRRESLLTELGNERQPSQSWSLLLPLGIYFWVYGICRKGFWCSQTSSCLSELLLNLSSL